MGNPLVIAIIASAAALVVLSVLGRLFGKRRALRDAARRSQMRRRSGYLILQQQEIERLASRILATSSTPGIAGFDITRQIEAVFTDGHISPTRAVDALKAAAAQRGANAVINLASERQPSGKCVARGDAVIVRPIETEPAPGTAPPTDTPQVDAADRTTDTGGATDPPAAEPWQESADDWDRVADADRARRDRS